jgi:hypothetical protein
MVHLPFDRFFLTGRFIPEPFRLSPEHSLGQLMTMTKTPWKTRSRAGWIYASLSIGHAS